MLEQCKSNMAQSMFSSLSYPPRLFPENIELNVGGKFYSTSVLTLTKEPESLLGRMFSGRQNVSKDQSGKYFIDRDGLLFRYILDYLRNKKLVLPDGFSEIRRLKLEAEFFEIRGLLQQLDEHCKARQQTTVHKRFGYITLHIRGTYAFGRSGQADVNFRKLQRIVVSGEVSLCREVFAETLNESRDPNPDESRYTNRFYLKHNYVEKAFKRLQDSGFQLVSSSAGKLSSVQSTQDTRSITGDEEKWNHFSIHVFLRR